MSQTTNDTLGPEIKAKGRLTENGVEVSERNSMDALSSRGYGTIADNTLVLSFYEALYLLEKEHLQAFNENKKPVRFDALLERYQEKNENAWVNYLVYRDLRTRGYVVREGSGAETYFRVYERGTYGKDTAQYLVLSIQEGKPLPMQDLKNAVQQCQSQKKELTIAVMNRRGETVYYSVSPLTFK